MTSLHDLAWLWAAPWPSHISHQQALLERLREAILQGRLAAGSRLPASRTLATTLNMARNTVLFAYAQLSTEGYVVSTPRGTRVAPLPAPPPTDRSHTWPELSQRARHLVPPNGHLDSTGLPFALGVPDIASFPIRAWRSSLDAAWRQATPRQLGYAPIGGEPALREALAHHLSSSRGLAVAPEQVIITHGTQSSLDVCARLLADAGDIAWVEDPGYPAAHAALAVAGLTLHPVPIDAAGLAPTRESAAQHPPKLIMVTPSHQFPTGVVMPIARRLALIDTALRHRAWIIEDDYDSEFHRTGPPLPALFGLQPNAPVVYAGTFSKTLFPALRLGYLIVPLARAAEFAQAAGHLMRSGHSIEQSALADFMRRGRYITHLRHMRRHYAQRRDALRQALQRHFGESIAITGGEAGLHLMIWWNGAPDAQLVSAMALQQGLAARPLSAYTLTPTHRQGLVLGYGGTPSSVMDNAVARLAQTWHQAQGCSSS